MKIVFRLNYHTTPGQSLWLNHSVVLGEGGIRFDQVTPMRWRSERQWEAEIDVRGAGKFRLEYGYQLRQEGNGVVLDEWKSRDVELDLDASDAVVLRDEWSSAGTPDYSFETKAFVATQRAQADFAAAPVPANANHTLSLRMATVPAGRVPCIIGSVDELGNWGWLSAVPLTEVEPNLWQLHVRLPADWRIEYKYGLYDPKLKCVVSVENGDNRVLERREIAARQWTHVVDECFRRGSAGLFRGAGVAMPVFSLRSAESLGVGEFADLKPFADWAADTGLKLVQILPINDTTSGHDWMDSYPYSAISVFALHPIYLRIDALQYKMPADFTRDLEAARVRLNGEDSVHHPEVMLAKRALTRRIFDKHRKAILGGAAFTDFLARTREWVVPYAVFCVKRDEFGTADFTQWADCARYDATRVAALAEPENPLWPELAYHIWLQCELDLQLADAVAHLHAKGLALKGDLPIGIDRQSVDAWSAPHLFKMDAQAGAPPDAFAVKGQNWGFPTYDWEVMRRDGYAWWQARFAQLSRYFDAYRIDHILGFFRIWQIPFDQIDGIMGWFDPALPIRIEEFGERDIWFDQRRFCQPYIRWDSLRDRFGDAAEYVRENFLEDCGDGSFRLREHLRTQRQIVEYLELNPHDAALREGLLDCASEVLFFEVPGSQGRLFHPRCGMKLTRTFQELDPGTRWKVEQLYNDYFFRRQEEFWQAEGLEKLPAMRRASDMLLCGEDLGMVPACVPGVLKELGILSLEIQRMPKTDKIEFFNPADAPYLSVVSPSTHDMPTLRAWWKEDRDTTGRFAWHMLGLAWPSEEMSGQINEQIVAQHLYSPAMWAIFPLQDLLGMEETLRHPRPEEERINIPAIMPFYWRYRMHLPISELAAATSFNDRLRSLIQNSGR